MLVDAGIEWVIIGHSERRHVFKETNEILSEKTKYVLSKPNVKVVFCIGELLEEREAGKTIDVCKEQLEYLRKVVEDWDRIVLAYEPVWAIGTGKVATIEQAQEVHKVVRDWLSESVSKEVASRVRVIYGGSVTAKNCGDLSRMPDIDGFLVGGASLKPEFTEIINIIASVKAE
jgi:triosephosphate isomerase (TIM)